MNVNYSKLLIAVTAAVLLSSSSVQASETDERIVDSANKSYVFKTYLSEDNINIQSKDGIVVLKGTVNDASHRSLAQETITSLPGVRSVDNQLVLKSDVPAEKSDSWIAIQVKTSLLFNRHVSGTKTQVSVVDGVVTLNGEAESQAQKDLVTEYTRDISGVKDIKNDMTVAKVSAEAKKTMGEKIDDASISAQVKTALLFYRSTSGLKIHVATNDGVVTLTGNARSAAERTLAAKYAGDVNGVNSVVNNVVVDDSLSKN